MKVDSERSDPRQLWRSVSSLMSRSRAPVSMTVGADEAHRFFDDKVAGVRASTDDVPPPTYTTAPTTCQLADFSRLSTDDVITAVHRLPDKRCQLDVMPTRMLKCNTDLLAPFLTELFNCSLALGSVPGVAFITPTLKKSDADAADITQYRPISNLLVLSKLLERLVAKQLLDYLSIMSAAA